METEEESSDSSDWWFLCDYPRRVNRSENNKILSLIWSLNLKTLNLIWKASRDGVHAYEAWWVTFFLILVFLERNLATYQRTVKLTPLNPIGNDYLWGTDSTGEKCLALWWVAHGCFPHRSAVHNSQQTAINVGCDTLKSAGIDKVHMSTILM